MRASLVEGCKPLEYSRLYDLRLYISDEDLIYVEVKSYRPCSKILQPVSGGQSFVDTAHLLVPSDGFAHIVLRGHRLDYSSIEQPNSP